MIYEGRRITTSQPLNSFGNSMGILIQYSLESWDVLSIVVGHLLQTAVQSIDPPSALAGGKHPPACSSHERLPPLTLPRSKRGTAGRFGGPQRTQRLSQNRFLFDHPNASSWTSDIIFEVERPVEHTGHPGCFAARKRSGDWSNWDYQQYIILYIYPKSQTCF